ncbi:MAG TPA: response regulator [Candidatus Bathyarchaeia archaeon]|nr:response regulator [Candidatus Bathyarchaeia archaeon]
MAKKILVIDDDPVTVRCLQKSLQAQGYTVLSAFDGVQGLETARSEKPDLITLDVMMPNLNGYSVCGFLRADAQLYTIPIIMITSRQEEFDHSFDKDFAPDAYIIKPFSMKEVLDKVQALLC